jgi:hypothetical protein
LARAAAVGFVALTASRARAEETPRAPEAAADAQAALDDVITELERELETPIEPKVKVPLQFNLDRGLGPHDRTQPFFKLEPVLPLRLFEGWVLVTRTILRFGYRPDTMAATGGNWGLGDLNPTFFVSPRYGDVLRWGVGPDLEVPTATGQSTGTGKWSLGPSLGIVLRPKPWVFGLVVSNIWSFAGDPDRSAVTRFSLQYLLHYNFGSRWVLTSSPTMIANWKAKAGQVWEIPVGGGVGKTFGLEGRALQVSLQAYAFPVTDGPTWQLRLQLTYLVPD